MKTQVAKTVKVKVPETKIYEMMDGESEVMGLLKTNLPLNKLEKEWTKHYNDTDLPEFGVSIFVDLMKEKHRASFFTFERVFCEATIYP